MKIKSNHQQQSLNLTGGQAHHDEENSGDTIQETLQELLLLVLLGGAGGHLRLPIALHLLGVSLLISRALDGLRQERFFLLLDGDCGQHFHDKLELSWISAMWRQCNE